MAGPTTSVSAAQPSVIEGPDVSAILADADVDISAVGSGRAILWGEGRYTIDGLISQPWSDHLKVPPY